MRKAWQWKQASYCMLWKEMHTSRKFEEFFRLFLSNFRQQFLVLFVPDPVLGSSPHVSASVFASISCLSVSLLSSCPSRSALSNHQLGSFRCLQLLLPPPPPLPYTDAIVPSSVLRFIRFHSSTLLPIGPCHFHLYTVCLQPFSIQSPISLCLSVSRLRSHFLRSSVCHTIPFMCSLNPSPTTYLGKLAQLF